MSPLRVRDELGAPESTRTNRSGDEVYRYPSVSLTFDLEGLAEVGLLPEAKPRIGPVDVLSPKGFSSLLRLDGQAYECVGLIVLLNLGLAVSGVHDNDRSQLAVTAFRRGRWDRLQDQMKPFRP
jgi:hypothetical protein